MKRKIIADTTDRISEKVNEIFAEHSPSTPVNVVDIARAYGFSVYQLSMDSNVSGLIIVDSENIQGFDTNKVIVINADHSFTRKRFTVAHELGHYFLRDKPQQCFAHRDAGRVDNEERDANRFASELLMPEDDFRREYNETASMYSSKALSMVIPSIIATVADKFNVSEAAAEIRMRELGLSV